MLYLLVSPNVYEKENGKMRKKEMRNMTIKNGERRRKRSKEKEKYTTQKRNDFCVP
jgi:hypothetical protein